MLRTLSGSVIDAESRQTLPGAHIRILGSNKGTMANADGAFRLVLPEEDQRVVVSYLGYGSDTLRLAVGSDDVQHTFALRSSPIPLAEVLVLGDASNPAEEIIKLAIEKKKKIRSRMETYDFSAYTKLTMRLKAQKRTRDSLTTGEVKTATRDTIVSAGVLETQIKGYGKEPGKFKEIILARKQTRNITPEINILGLANIPNLNDDRVKVFDKLVVGPTAPDALEYYSYRMIDTLSVNKTVVWRIALASRSASLPLFEGTIAVADGSYRILDCDVSGNDALSRSAPLKSVHVRQQFGDHSDPFLLPLESNLALTLQFPGLVFPILVDHIGVIHDYHVNTDISDSTFDQFSVTVHPQADRVDSAGWSQMQAPPLTLEEQHAYRVTDSLFTHNRTFAAMIWIARLPFWLAERPFTDFSDYFRFNRVEGAFLGGGYDSKHLFASTRFVARAGYAFAQDALKYGFSVEHYFTTNKSTSMGAETHRSILSRSDHDAFDLAANSLFALFWKEDPSDYFEGKGFSFFARQQISNDVSMQVKYLDEQQTSLGVATRFSLFDTQSEYRPNPAINDGHLRSAIVSLTYDTRKLIQFGPFNVPDGTSDSWNINAEYEYTDPSFLDSDFGFHRAALTLHMRKHLLGDRTFSLFGRFGLSEHALPAQRLFDVSYGAESIIPLGAFRTVGIKELAGDRIAMLMMELNLSGALFRRIDLPYLRDLQLILYAGSAWSDLSGPSKSIQTVQIATARQLFHEAGFGIGNLPLGLRLDLTWRLTHRNGNNFLVTLGSSLF